MKNIISLLVALVFFGFMLYPVTTNVRKNKISKDPKITLYNDTIKLKESDEPVILKHNIKTIDSENNVIWKFYSNDTIAKIENGKITPLKAGEDKIIVNYYNEADTCVLIISVDSLRYFKTKCEKLNNSISQLESETDRLKNKPNDPRFWDVKFQIIIVSLVLIIILTLILQTRKLLLQRRKLKMITLKLDKLRSDYNALERIYTELNKNYTKLYNLYDKSIEFSKRVHDLDFEKRQDLELNRITFKDDRMLKSKVSQIIQENIYVNELSDQKTKTVSNESLNSVVKPQILYADAIIDGRFNKVKANPSEDSIFELKLNEPGEDSASIEICESAHSLVTKRPEFLEGCDKHVIGNTFVTLLRPGIAKKDSNGKWVVTVPPEVKIY